MRTEPDQGGVVLDQLGAEQPHLHQADDEHVNGIGGHRWTSYIEYGGHFLLICACECPGPFVMDLNDRALVRCGVALAWREGVARLALCSGKEVKALHG